MSKAHACIKYRHEHRTINCNILTGCRVPPLTCRGFKAACSWRRLAQEASPVDPQKTCDSLPIWLNAHLRALCATCGVVCRVVICSVVWPHRQRGGGGKCCEKQFVHNQACSGFAVQCSNWKAAKGLSTLASVHITGISVCKAVATDGPACRISDAGNCETFSGVASE